MKNPNNMQILTQFNSLVIFDNTNVVTFPKTENLNVLVTGQLTGSHFETHAFRNIEAYI